MTLLKQLEENQKEILAIAAKHGAFNVRVFGSVARKLCYLSSSPPF